jgi:putative transposase
LLVMANRCRAFRFVLQPTTRQRFALERLVAAQRELYNAALEERRGAWAWERRRVTKSSSSGLSPNYGRSDLTSWSGA